jgi:hypothetical protein
MLHNSPCTRTHLSPSHTRVAHVTVDRLLYVRMLDTSINTCTHYLWPCTSMDGKISRRGGASSRSPVRLQQAGCHGDEIVSACEPDGWAIACAEQNYRNRPISTLRAHPFAFTNTIHGLLSKSRRNTEIRTCSAQNKRDKKKQEL